MTEKEQKRKEYLKAYYLAKKDKIKQILDHIEYDWPIDWELSRLISKLNLKSCLTFPFIEQGSELHQYKSNLR